MHHAVADQPGADGVGWVGRGGEVCLYLLEQELSRVLIHEREQVLRRAIRTVAQSRPRLRSAKSADFARS